MNKLVRNNPQSMPAPVGNYSHITKVPKDAEFVVFSGQVGTNAIGKIPGKFNEQVKNTFENIEKALLSESLRASDIVKVNIWSVEDIDWDYFYKTWDEFFDKEDYPSMTIGYIKALGLPEIKIEIEIWAAKIQK